MVTKEISKKRSDSCKKKLDILNENNDSQSTTTQSIEHATGTLKVPGSSPENSFFGQNLRIFASFEKNGKIQKPMI